MRARIAQSAGSSTAGGRAPELLEGAVVRPPVLEQRRHPADALLGLKCGMARTVCAPRAARPASSGAQRASYQPPRRRLPASSALLGRKPTTSALAWPWPMPCSLWSQATISMCFRACCFSSLNQWLTGWPQVCVDEVGRGAFDFVFGGHGATPVGGREQGGEQGMRKRMRPRRTGAGSTPRCRILQTSGRSTQPPEGDPMAMPHAGSGELIPIRPLGVDLPQHRTRALVKTARLELVRLVLLAGRVAAVTPGAGRHHPPVPGRRGHAQPGCISPSPCGPASWSIWRAAQQYGLLAWVTHPFLVTMVLGSGASAGSG